MPYKDPDKRKQATREAMQKKRAAAILTPVKPESQIDRTERKPEGLTTCETTPALPITATEKMWLLLGTPNVWTRYEGEQGFACCKGLGLCCLPLMWRENRPIKECYYTIEYCIYFLQAASS